MLQNVDPRLSPDLLRDLAILGHNDRVLIADLNFPAGKLAVPVHYLPLPASDVLAAVLSVFPLEVSADDAVVVRTDRPSTPLDESQRASLDIVRQAQPDFARFGRPDPAAGFLPVALSARVAVITGEIAKSCYVLRRGIAF